MIHEPNTRAFDLKTGLLRTKRHGVLSDRVLEHLVVSDWGLFWALPVQGKKITYMQAHILPELGIQVVRFGWKSEFMPDFDYYVDIIDLTERTSECWSYVDLYLDVTVTEAKNARLLDTDEYNAAVKRGFLTKAEQSLALSSTHSLMNTLADTGYSLEALLLQKDIELNWVEV